MVNFTTRSLFRIQYTHAVAIFYLLMIHAQTCNAETFVGYCLSWTIDQPQWIFPSVSLNVLLLADESLSANLHVTKCFTK